MGSSISRILGVPSAAPMITAEAPVLERPPAQSSSLPLAPPLKRFKFFPRLPAELRLMIWELALPGERVVRIQDFPECIHKHQPSAVCRCIGSKARVPTLLHVCHESRALALKHYTITFENRMFQPTYFNPNLDILYFASVDDFMKFAHPVPVYSFPEDPYFEIFAPYRVSDDPLYPISYPPRRLTDNEDIESKLRYLAIGWAFPFPYNPAIDCTPWESISYDDMLNYIGEFRNLDTLFVEDIFFEDTGLHFFKPSVAVKYIKWLLSERWVAHEDGARKFPELVTVGSTMMKQMRFRAREARLRSWERLADHIPVPSTAAR
ncbi:hypothetical protein VTL71DRAFT_7952 [Oculimacula yallundae]|uniref:2EXR domain-containing protein n=1 Tax=Oculimacula yallundae TaxID=86028 RepID=A0ABR4CW80_9HELO